MTSKGGPVTSRSVLMAGIRQLRTAPEEIVAGVLRALSVGDRRHVRALPGSPYFANGRRRFAIFVNGCFWHHHKNCARGSMPRTNAEFRSAKFAANRARDARSFRSLCRRGFKVVLVWECATADTEKLKNCLSDILEARCIDR